MSVEHRDRKVPRDIYANTFLACRFCNGSRGIKPERDPVGGGALLDPTMESWAAHFVRAETGLLPMHGDRDAEYTYETYDLDEPRKIELRGKRAAILDEAMRALDDGPWLIARLMGELEKQEGADGRSALVREIQLAELWIARAKENLARFQAVPADADASCRCNSSPRLPPHIATQCVPIDVKDA